MVKAPVAGRVKTRLAAEIGVARSTYFYRHTVAAVMARVARERQWRIILCVTPDAASTGSFWPANIARRGQGHGDLGERMQRVLDDFPAGPVIIVGSDIPRIRPGLIRSAFHALGGHDAVFGPSPDGGYWLVGVRRSPRILRPFVGVRWSSPNALEDTLGNLRGLRVATVATLRDIDDARDFQRETAAHGRRVLPAAKLRI